MAMRHENMQHEARCMHTQTKRNSAYARDADHTAGAQKKGATHSNSQVATRVLSYWGLL